MFRTKKFTAVALLLCVFLSLGILLTACNDEAVELSVPIVNISGGGAAGWTAVANASGYKYKINGGAEIETQSTSVQLTDGQSIAVKSVGDGKNYKDSAYSAVLTYTAPQSNYGLPVPEIGHYFKDADVIEENATTRYLVYVTNLTGGEEDNVIAVRKGTHDGTGWTYGKETVAVEGDESAWDKYVGSASIVKGTFAYTGKTYNYLMAYQATAETTEKCFQIGLAAAETPDGKWVKIGQTPVIEYDKAVYGSFAGCYSPSVVNYDRKSGIRIFYTYADAYGHFAKFFDADMSDLSSINGQTAQAPNHGNIHGGDAELMFPNGDFLYDSANGKFISVKDFSPAAATIPQFSTKIELCEIAEAELYTTDKGQGWQSLGYWDELDLEIDYFRIYSASVVSDAYGHKLDGGYEIIYNVCQTKEDSPDYLFTQKFLSFVYEAE